MAPKRKSDDYEIKILRTIQVTPNCEKYVLNWPPSDELYPPAKKARLSEPSDASGSSSVDKDASKNKKPTSWRDITLPGEDEARRSPSLLRIDATDTRICYLNRVRSPSTMTAARSVAKSDSCRRPQAGK